MAQILTFFDKEHKYTLDGDEIPSVSELSRFASREIYQTVEQFQLDRAAARGTAVHQACENIDRYSEVKCNNDIAGYVKAYIKFRGEHPIEYDTIERAFAGDTPEGKFAGTIDRAGVFADGQTAIIDLKTSSVVQKPLAQIQLNAYKLLYEQNTGKKVDKLFILHLKKEGDYKLIEFPIDDTLFKACIALHYALKKKPRKKKETKDE